MDFNDVAALPLQWFCHLIERIFGVFAEDGLSGAKTNFGLRVAGVLIEASDFLLHRRNPRRSFGRGRLRHLRFVGRVGGVLIGEAGFL